MGYYKGNSQLNEPSFSIGGFKKWIKDHNEQHQTYPEKKGIGDEVEPRVIAKRSEFHIMIEEGEANTLLNEFYSSGGKIIDIDNDYVMIEVTSGTFILPKFCVRKKH